MLKEFIDLLRVDHLFFPEQEIRYNRWKRQSHLLFLGSLGLAILSAVLQSPIWIISAANAQEGIDPNLLGWSIWTLLIALSLMAFLAAIVMLITAIRRARLLRRFEDQEQEQRREALAEPSGRR